MTLRRLDPGIRAHIIRQTLVAHGYVSAQATTEQLCTILESQPAAEQACLAACTAASAQPQQETP